MLCVPFALIRPGARRPVLEAELALPRGLLPFSVDLYMTWHANIHAEVGNLLMRINRNLFRGAMMEPSLTGRTLHAGREWRELGQRGRSWIAQNLESSWRRWPCSPRWRGWAQVFTDCYSTVQIFFATALSLWLQVWPVSSSCLRRRPTTVPSLFRVMSASCQVQLPFWLARGTRLPSRAAQTRDRRPTRPVRRTIRALSQP